MTDQIERAATSIALNLAEGNATRDGNRRARFANALGSAQETRVALRVAAAWGWLDASEVRDLDAALDSICAMIYRLRR